MTPLLIKMDVIRCPVSAGLNFHGTKLLRMAVEPRKPRKFSTAKVKVHTVSGSFNEDKVKCATVEREYVVSCSEPAILFRLWNKMAGWLHDLQWYKNVSKVHRGKGATWSLQAIQWRQRKNAHLNNCFIAYYQLKLYCYKVVIKSSAFAIDYR